MREKIHFKIKKKDHITWGTLLLFVFKQWLLEAALRFRVSKSCQQRWITEQRASGAVKGSQ